MVSSFGAGNSLRWVWGDLSGFTGAIHGHQTVKPKPPPPVQVEKKGQYRGCSESMLTTGCSRWTYLDV